MITVVDPDAARRALLAGLLTCPEPGCEGVLRVWSRARTRRVRRLDGALIALRPDRARCRRCAVTHLTETQPQPRDALNTSGLTNRGMFGESTGRRMGDLSSA